MWSLWMMIWPLFFFLLGSIPTGYLLGRLHGVDIRNHGSGNIGATNVGRVLGKKWGIIAFFCDFLKGFLMLFLLRVYIYSDITSQVATLLVLSGIAAILGHNYTPWLGFKGGKGIATSAGVLAALVPYALVVVFSLWYIVMKISRYVSVGSITACIFLPITTFYFYPYQWIYLGLATVACLLGIWRHRGNIQRLLAGTESKIGATPVSSQEINS